MALALDKFERAARAYAAAVEAKAAALGNAPTGDCRIIVFDGERLDEAAGQAGASIEELQEARTELQEALTAHSVSVSVDVFVQAKSDQQSNQPDSDGDLKRKYELVGEIFDLTSLRQRTWAKFSSKTLNFGRMDWEILWKRQDDDVPRPDGSYVPIAQVQLGAWNPKTGNAARSESIVFAVDEVDIEVMIEGLERLRDALRENGGENG